MDDDVVVMFSVQKVNVRACFCPSTAEHYSVFRSYSASDVMRQSASWCVFAEMRMKMKF